MAQRLLIRTRLSRHRPESIDSSISTIGQLACFGTYWNSEHTGYVLAGENAGSKREKAKSPNTPVLDEAAFEELLS